MQVLVTTFIQTIRLWFPYVNNSTLNSYNFQLSLPIYWSALLWSISQWLLLKRNDVIRGHEDMYTICAVPVKAILVKSLWKTTEAIKFFVTIFFSVCNSSNIDLHRVYSLMEIPTFLEHLLKAVCLRSCFIVRWLEP